MTVADELFKTVDIEDLLLDEFQCSLGLWGVRAEPYTDIPGVTVYFAHSCNLLVALIDVSLVDADGIYPKVSGHFVVTQGAKCFVQVS